MRPPRLLIVLLLIGATFAMVWGWLSTSADNVPNPSPRATPSGTSAQRPMPPAAWPPASTDATATVEERVPLPPIERMEPAAQTLAQAMANGDDRMPPIARSEPGEQPTAVELANPEAYQRYEARQHMKLLSNYVAAANQALPQLQRDIERGRAAGIAPADIAKAEAKARAIADMKAELQKQYPELRDKP
ncbi:hypothetical protein [Chitinivorax sp. B]|uniref:hypothetical protein n=1 Tax=Chitinivorax sp. B TaxID=2502235 RepID=UPI0010F7D4D7|nr:hypothetical protein [Chitinivorax sp. B]